MKFLIPLLLRARPRRDGLRLEEERLDHVDRLDDDAASSAFKVGLSTDTGGLNDRSFNHLAYVGLQQAQKDLGVQTRVVQATSPADYIPNLSALAQQGYNLVIARRLHRDRRAEGGREAVPEDALRDRRRLERRRGRAEERAGPPLQGAGGRLPRRLRGGPRRQAARRQGGLVGRRREAAAGRPLHRRLPGRRQGGRPRDPRR